MNDNHKPLGQTYILKRTFCSWHISNICLLAEIISNGGISGEVKEEI